MTPNQKNSDEVCETPAAESNVQLEPHTATLGEALAPVLEDLHGAEQALQAAHHQHQHPSGSTVVISAPAAQQVARWQGIPQELRVRPQWCFTSPVDKDKLKAPRKEGGQLASPTNPAEWMPFEKACEYAIRVGGHIGYMLHESDKYICIDLDVKHNTPPEQWERFQKIVETFDSYTERSLSGSGYHVWIEGTLDAGCRRDGVEVYSRERFIICTGNVEIDKPIAPRPERLKLLVSEIRAAQATTAVELVEVGEAEPDEVIWQRGVDAANGDKFRQLWDGKWSEMGFPSQSEADFALLSMLAFYSKANEQVRRLFRMSELGKREKATKNNAYIDRSLSRLRAREQREDEQVAAIRAQMPGMDAAIDAALAQRRESQRFKFKQIGEGEPDLTALNPPNMDADAMGESLVLVATARTHVAFRDNPAICLPLADARVLLANCVKEYTDEKGKQKQFSIFAQWLKDERRKTVYTLTFDPRAGEFCMSPDNRAALNLWKVKPHTCPDDWETLVRPFVEHVRYLVPVEFERERFLDWLAHIDQCPGALPHSHYLMIATAQGVGRNWLAGLLACIWSGHVALDFDLKQSLQSGFNGQLSRKLLAVVDEINEGGKSERWEHSEKLKSMVTASERFINPKYGLQHSEVNCCRWLLFSNHESALPLSADDRRWNVIRNPNEPRGAEYYERLYSLLSNKPFVAAVREYLLRRDITRFNPGQRAAQNEAKQAVIASGYSMEDENALALVAAYPSDLITNEYLFMEIYGVEPSVCADASRKWKLIAPIAKKAGIVKLAKELRYPGRKPVKVWALRNAEQWTQVAAGDAIERELARKV